MPGIAAVLHGVVVAHGTAAVQGFKGTVLNHFGVEAAVGSVVDVLKEQADHPGLNRGALFIGNVQLHEAYHPFHTHKTPGIRAYALLHSACTGEFLLPGTDSPGNGAIAPGGHTKKTNRIICMETVWADFVSSTNLEDTHIRPASKPEGPQKEKVKVRQAHIVMKKLVRYADSMDTWCVEIRQCARGVSLAFHMSIGIPPGTGQASGLHMDAAALEA